MIKINLIKENIVRIKKVLYPLKKQGLIMIIMIFMNMMTIMIIIIIIKMEIIEMDTTNENYQIKYFVD